MIMFRRELKDNIKDEIMRDERDYKSFAELIEIVIDLDNKLYERAMKKQYDQFKDKAELIYESAAKYAKSKQQSYIRNLEYTESASIKLNMTHWRKEKNLKSKKKSKKKEIVLRMWKDRSLYKKLSQWKCDALATIECYVEKDIWDWRHEKSC